jgi:Zn finger protein HypA/HybF involved in hydrogenase expression
MVPTIECENCGEECADLGYRYQVCPNCGNPLYLESDEDG